MRNVIFAIVAMLGFATVADAQGRGFNFSAGVNLSVGRGGGFNNGFNRGFHGYNGGFNGFASHHHHGGFGFRPVFTVPIYTTPVYTLPARTFIFADPGYVDPFNTFSGYSTSYSSRTFIFVR